jgi:hypothetical protein
VISVSSEEPKFEVTRIEPVCDNLSDIKTALLHDPPYISFLECHMPINACGRKQNSTVTADEVCNGFLKRAVRRLGARNLL